MISVYIWLRETLHFISDSKNRGLEKVAPGDFVVRVVGASFHYKLMVFIISCGSI